MHTQKHKSITKTYTPVFLLSGDPEPSSTFVAGKCVCKACRSTKLSYFAYLEDAKCECGQWQNESLILD